MNIHSAVTAVHYIFKLILELLGLMISRCNMNYGGHTRVHAYTEGGKETYWPKASARETANSCIPFSLSLP